MPKIFISYRRDDSQVFAGRIRDKLVSHFGSESVFMDVNSIPFGVDFRQHLIDAVSGCDVFLALIGGAWLTTDPNGQRRLDDPRDFVRIEIEAALLRGIPVIPVLLGDTSMPHEDELPTAISSLVFRNAAQIDSGRRFHDDMDGLIRGLKAVQGKPVQHDEPKTVAKAQAESGTDQMEWASEIDDVLEDTAADQRAVYCRGRKLRLVKYGPENSRADPPLPGKKYYPTYLLTWDEDGKRPITVTYRRGTVYHKGQPLNLLKYGPENSRVEEPLGGSPSFLKPTNELALDAAGKIPLKNGSL